MNCEQNLVILRISKRCVEACLAQTPLYFVEQFVFICSAIKHRNTGKEKLFTHTKRYRAYIIVYIQKCILNAIYLF